MATSMIESQILLGSAHNDGDDDFNDQEEEEEYISDDSYDDGYRHSLTTKENRIYSKQIEESDGFDVDGYPDVEIIGLIEPIDIVEGKELDKIIHCAKLSLADYNTKNVTDWKFSKFIKANCQVLCGMRYYITFEAMGKGAACPSDDYSQVFQAMVMTLSGKVELELCRPKPTH